MHPNRKLIRLKGHNYADDNLYYITICVDNRRCLLGNCINQKMKLSTIGEIAHQYWLDIPNHNENAVLHEFVIMPNHLHGIIELNNSHFAETSHFVVGRDMPWHVPTPRHVPTNGNQFGKPIPGSVSVIINQFKSSVKRWCNKNIFSEFQWQSRFYDHIIRSYDEYMRISDYINDNPAKWEDDQWYPH